MGDCNRPPYRRPPTGAPSSPSQSGLQAAAHANREFPMELPTSATSTASIESTPRSAGYLVAQPHNPYGVFPHAHSSRPTPYKLPSPAQPQYPPYFGGAGSAYAASPPQYAQSPSAPYPASVPQAHSQQQTPQQFQPHQGVPRPHMFQPQHQLPGGYYPVNFQRPSASPIYQQQVPSNQYSGQPCAQFQKPGELHKNNSPPFRPGVNAVASPPQQNEPPRINAPPIQHRPYGTPHSAPQYLHAPPPYQMPAYPKPPIQGSPQYGQLPLFQAQPMQQQQQQQTRPPHQSPGHQQGSPQQQAQMPNQGHQFPQQQPGAQSPPFYSPIALSPNAPHQGPKKQTPPTRPFFPPAPDSKIPKLPAPDAGETAIETVSTMTSLSGAALLGANEGSALEGLLASAACNQGPEPSAPPLTVDGKSLFGEPEEYDLPAAAQTMPDDARNLKLMQKTRPPGRHMYSALKRSATRGMELVSDDEAAN